MTKAHIKLGTESGLLSGRAGITPGHARKLLSPMIGERITLAVASILVNALALAFPLMMLQLFDRIIPHQSVDTLFLVSVTVALAVIVESLLRLARAYLTAWSAARFEHRALMAVAERVLAEPLHQLEQGGGSEALERFKAVSTIKHHYAGQMFQQLLDLPFFTVVYLGLIFLMSPWIGFMLVGGYVIFVVVTWGAGAKFPQLVLEQKSADTQRGNFLLETINNIHTMKSMTMESLAIRHHERLQEKCARLIGRVTYALDMSAGLGTVFSPLMTILTAVIGAWLVINGKLSNGELAACVMLGMRSLAPLQRLGGIWSRHQQDTILRKELVETLQQPPLPATQQGKPGEYAAAASLVADRPLGVELDDLGYRFPGASHPMFRNLSLKIAPGECLLLDGGGGAGRSTLLHLIAGVTAPDHGKVLIDGVDIHAPTSPSLASLVGYLPHHADLFEGTLLENVTVFDAVRIPRALEIAGALGLADFVARLPKGWETAVGDSASEILPPGYRQRIALVRALASGPGVLLIDDAASMIDAHGEALLLAYLESVIGKATIIMASHQPAFRHLATRTVQLHHGLIVLDTPGQAPVSSAQASADRGETAAQLTAPFLPEAFEGGPISCMAPRTGDDPEHQDRWAQVSAAVASRFPRQSDLARCLTALLRALNGRQTGREVTEALPHDGDCLDLHGFEGVMVNLGFSSKRTRCALGAIESRRMPCLFVPDEGPALVVIGRSGDQIRVNGYPAGSVAQSDQSLRGYAYFFEPVEKRAADGKSWVWRAVTRFSPLLFQAMIAAVMVGATTMIAPLFLNVVYATIIPSGALDSLWYVSAGALMAILLGYAFMRQRARILAQVAARIDYLFGASILQQVLHMAPSFTERASVGSQTTRLQSFDAIRDMFTGPLAATILESPATLIMLAVLGFMNPVALIVYVVMVVVYLLLFKLFSSRSKDRVARVATTSARRNEFLIEMVARMRAVRECNAQQIWLARFREISAAATMSAFRSEQLSALLTNISYCVMTMSALGIIVVSVPAVWSQAVTAGGLIASMMLMWRVLSPLQTLFSGMTRVDRVVSVARQIDALMKIPGERPDTPGLSASRRSSGRIEFARVSFRYATNVDAALVGVECRIDPGDMVAITGPNGGGKSTLLKLILGMYQPQAGAILIDNIDIRQLDPVVLRRMVGYTPQEIRLFQTTIEQNLRLARPDATSVELHQALEMAGALAQVEALPGAMQYRVGPNGKELSSSLRQKLSLARAYLSRAPIMLFDELGAGLDPQGVAQLEKTLAFLKGRATVIFISHQPELIHLADTLLVFDKGYLKAAGAPSALLTPRSAPVSGEAK